MGRSPCCSKEGLNRGAWTALEDKLLISYVEAHGEGKWRNLPHRAGLKRCGKSCRLRWLNYLRPNIKRGNITRDEEDLIIRLHKLLGNRWSLIAGRLPGRTDNEIKNYWNTTLAKKLKLPSSAMSEQRPSSKSRTSKEVTEVTQVQPQPQPQVIQTRASRCRNVVILAPQYPNENSNINSQASNQIEFDEAHLTIRLTNQSQGSHTPKPKVNIDEDQVHENHNSYVNLWSCGSNDRFQLNATNFCEDGVFNLDSSMDVDAPPDTSLPIDELMVNGWTTTTSGFEVDDNGAMDLDSLALLLDSGDWP